jgi:DnaJ-class molecular chaperone
MNPYEVLEIPSDANEKDIKDAYKSMAKKWHPDRNKAPEATEKFKEINKAYNILIDPKLRQMYDRTGSVDEQQMPDIDINEILRGMGGMPFMGGMPGMSGMPGMGGMPFGMGGVFVNGVPFGMGGGGGMNPQELFMRKNSSIKMVIQLNLIDLFNGIKKTVEYQYKNLENGSMIKDSIELNILKGSCEGQEILFKNKGHLFKNNRGDLIIQIKEINHKDFVRLSNSPSNLLYNLKISLVQSICGFNY